MHGEQPFYLIFASLVELMPLETGHANMVALITIWKAFPPVVPKIVDANQDVTHLGVGGC